MNTFYSTTPILNRPDNSFSGRVSYSDAFARHLFQNDQSYPVMNALSTRLDSTGSYLVPDEMDRHLVEALENENVIRKYARIVKTESGDHKIPLVVDSGTAYWIDEQEEIPESDPVFGMVNLGAHKLARRMLVSEEFLNDNAVDALQFIAKEFGRCMGRAEEQAFFTGDGNCKPLGLLADQGGAELGVTAAAKDKITADELIDLVHSLKPGYRKNAVFIMNDKTYCELKKLKNADGDYIFVPQIDQHPDGYKNLLGHRVLISDNMPEMVPGAKAVLFADLRYYLIADRQERSFRRLNELYAARDMIGFQITERLDGRLLLTEAAKVLQMKA